jgi:tryptophan synthase alpha chain
MSRLTARLAALNAAGRTALIPYIAAGHPNAACTVSLLHALARAGADVIELGIPFSDPMADGPIVQRASEIGIANGVGLKTVLSMVSQFRQSDEDTPVVLMGYANPIERFGLAAFPSAAQAAGVDGVLVLDYPPEESESFTEALRLSGIDPIFLVAPTSTPARIARLAEQASGYVYYVSLKGTTGAAHLDIAEVASRIPAIRRSVKLPIMVGFGIRDVSSARAVGAVADGVVIGSRIIEELEKGAPEAAVAATESLVRRFREGLDVPLPHFAENPS